AHGDALNACAEGQRQLDRITSYHAALSLASADQTEHVAHRLAAVARDRRARLIRYRVAGEGLQDDQRVLRRVEHARQHLLAQPPQPFPGGAGRAACRISQRLTNSRKAPSTISVNSASLVGK